MNLFTICARHKPTSALEVFRKSFFSLPYTLEKKFSSTCLDGLVIFAKGINMKHKCKYAFVQAQHICHRIVECMEHIFTSVVYIFEESRLW